MDTSLRRTIRAAALGPPARMPFGVPPVCPISESTSTSQFLVSGGGHPSDLAPILTPLFVVRPATGGSVWVGHRVAVWGTRGKNVCANRSQCDLTRALTSARDPPSQPWDPR